MYTRISTISAANFKQKQQQNENTIFLGDFNGRVRKIPQRGTIRTDAKMYT